MVDAIAEETNFRFSGWAQARVGQVNGDTLHLEFINDVKTTDRYLDRWSVEMAQFETKTKDLFEWKKNLKVGDLVDANDKATWNKSTILELKTEKISDTREVIMAKIGFRVYQENGTKNDKIGAFEGWSDRFDEWIGIFSPRI